MSLLVPHNDNTARVVVALLGVGLVLVVTMLLGVTSKPHKRVSHNNNLLVLQPDVRAATQKALLSYKVSGQMDPSEVAGMNNLMAPGMSAWYVGDNRVRIARPGGCLVWVHEQQVRFNAACRR